MSAEDYQFDEYEEGQWWLLALAKGGPLTDDMKRAQGVAVNFAKTAFAHVAELQAEIDRLKAQLAEKGE